MRKIYILILLLFIKFDIKSQSLEPYMDIVIAPIMAYNISEKGSNIPTHFLVANGVKGNIGLEVGLKLAVSGSAEDAKSFIIAGVGRHFMGFDYGGSIVKLGQQRISNHQHGRVFFGGKLIPFKDSRSILANRFSISATMGYGNITTNFSSKNINGKIKARASDFSIAFSLGLFSFQL